MQSMTAVKFILAAYFVNAVLSSDECGVGEPQKLAFGDDIIEVYPWSVLLEYVSSKNVSSLTCGGVLIDKEFVLTSAYCIREKVFPKLVNVRLGKWDQNKLKNCDPLKSVVQCADPVQKVNISNTFVHKDYKVISRSVRNDIALVQLSKPIEFNEFIQPICLPKSNETKNIVAGDELTTFEWYTIQEKTNDTKFLNQVAVESNEKCNKIFKFEGDLENMLNDSHICTTGACGLGGMSVLKKYESESGKITYHTEGIVSFGGFPCRAAPDVNTRVSAYLDWINSKILS